MYVNARVNASRLEAIQVHFLPTRVPSRCMDKQIYFRTVGGRKDKEKGMMENGFPQESFRYDIVSDGETTIGAVMIQL